MLIVDDFSHHQVIQSGRETIYQAVFFSNFWCPSSSNRRQKVQEMTLSGLNCSRPPDPLSWFSANPGFKCPPTQRLLWQFDLFLSVIFALSWKLWYLTYGWILDPPPPPPPTQQKRPALPPLWSTHPWCNTYTTLNDMLIIGSHDATNLKHCKVSPENLV
jgi:hypothetical protein